MYLFTTLAFFCIGGFFALLIRIEHLTPGKTIMEANMYNTVFYPPRGDYGFYVYHSQRSSVLRKFLASHNVGSKRCCFSST